MAEANPYSPPTEVETPKEPDENLASVDQPPKKLLLAWTAVVVINLPVPILFASEILGPLGWSGVLLAVGIFMIAGWCCCFRFKGVLKRLVAGSVVVAASQFLPIVHVIAGAIAIEIAMFVGAIGPARGDAVGPDIKSVFGGWMVTTLTGGILAATALFIGTMMFLVMSFGKAVEELNSPKLAE